MVQLSENEVTITINHPSPTEYLIGVQQGIIEMVKSLLSVTGPQKEFVLDHDTTQGCIDALTLVQATLPDAETIEFVQKLADRVMPTHQEVE